MTTMSVRVSGDVRPSRALHVGLWVVQGLLGAMFVAAARRASSGRRGTVGATLLLLLVLSAPVGAQDDVDLAKKTQNPVADLISVPFENNINFGVGPHDDAQYILYVQAGNSLPAHPRVEPDQPHRGLRDLPARARAGRR